MSEYYSQARESKEIENGNEPCGEGPRRAHYLDIKDALCLSRLYYVDCPTERMCCRSSSSVIAFDPHSPPAFRCSNNTPRTEIPVPLCQL